MANKKTLLVDDENDVLTVLSRQLEDKGYEVFTAKNGNDALQIASAKEPDIAMLDLALPDIPYLPNRMILMKLSNGSRFWCKIGICFTLICFDYRL